MGPPPEVVVVSFCFDQSGPENPRDDGADRSILVRRLLTQRPVKIVFHPRVNDGFSHVEMYFKYTGNHGVFA